MPTSEQIARAHKNLSVVDWKALKVPQLIVKDIERVLAATKPQEPLALIGTCLETLNWLADAAGTDEARVKAMALQGVIEQVIREQEGQNATE